MSQANHQKPLYQRAWEILGETPVFSHMPWVHVVRQHVRLPNGVEIPDFYRIDMPIFSVIFPVTTAKQVVLVEQYRLGAKAVALELPAGDIEENPTPQTALAAAQRELLEETGYSAPNWHFLGKFFIDSNRGAGEAYAYLAMDAEQSQDAEPEETEIINQKLMSLAEVRTAWRDGTINNIVSSAVIGLALAKLTELEQPE